MPELGTDIDDLCELVAAGVVDQAQRLHAGLQLFGEFIVIDFLVITMVLICKW